MFKRKKTYCQFHLIHGSLLSSIMKMREELIRDLKKSDAFFPQVFIICPFELRKKKLMGVLSDKDPDLFNFLTFLCFDEIDHFFKQSHKDDFMESFLFIDEISLFKEGERLSQLSSSSELFGNTFAFNSCDEISHNLKNELLDFFRGGLEYGKYFEKEVPFFLIPSDFNSVRNFLHVIFFQIKFLNKRAIFVCHNQQEAYDHIQFFQREKMTTQFINKKEIVFNEEDIHQHQCFLILKESFFEIKNNKMNSIVILKSVDMGNWMVNYKAMNFDKNLDLFYFKEPLTYFKKLKYLFGLKLKHYIQSLFHRLWAFFYV